jgi:hypothetical protein
VQSGTQPLPGFYAAVFYLRYDTDTIKDADGNTIRISPDSPGSLTVSAVAPMAWHVSEAKVFGANYGAMVAVPLANASIEAPAIALDDTVDTSLSDLLLRPIEPGLAHQARGGRRRAPDICADGPLRAWRRRQHRQGGVDLRALPRHDRLLR